MNCGFVRVGAAVPSLKVANCEYNARQILEMVHEAEQKDIQILVFPELSITAYTCGDLFHQHRLLQEAVRQLENILINTKECRAVVIAGMPLYLDNQLFNCGVVVQKGKILGVVPKTYIPGYSEFYEERWFSSGARAKSSWITLLGQQVPFGTDILFEDPRLAGMCFGVEICEDLWVPIPPSSYQTLGGASIIFNLSASNEVIGKHEYRRELIRQQSGKCMAAYVYASCGINESTTDVVFGGYAAVAENGGMLAESERFSYDPALLCVDVDIQKLTNNKFKNTSFMESEAVKTFRKVEFQLKDTDFETLQRYIDPHPFVPSNPHTRDERCSEIFAIQSAGLAKRLKHTGVKCAVLGISGGLDSTLALLVTAKAFDMLQMPRENIIAVTMPGFGTTDMTYTNALEFMQSTGVSSREVIIKDACMQHFKDIGHDPAIHDVTYENVQARERTQILMDIANKNGGFVVGTGDLSELALGWATYNGDHMSMYAVNTSIPKTLVKFLVQWVADNQVDDRTRQVLYRIIDTPISPELLPPDAKGDIHQKTEDIVGPYELHDFFLYHMLRYGAPPKKILFLARQAFKDRYDSETIKSWLKVFYKRFFSQQYKRSCLPDGPKVGTISLSPRGDWRMPSDADSSSWLKELEQ